jgi:hypothetical protein
MNEIMYHQLCKQQTATVPLKFNEEEGHKAARHKLSTQRVSRRLPRYSTPFYRVWFCMALWSRPEETMEVLDRIWWFGGNI